MRNFVAALASLVATTAVAHADPIAISTNLGAQPSKATYVAGGLEAGGNDGFLTLGGTLEIGHRVAPDLWVHAVAAEGATGQIFATGSGTYTQLRAGADLMSCGSTGVLCIFLGGDLGYQHLSFTGHEDPIFLVGGDGGYTPPADTTTVHSSMIGVARVGLDIGGTNLRWRPSIEGGLSSDHGSVNVMQSLAYRF